MAYVFCWRFVPFSRTVSIRQSEYLIFHGVFGGIFIQLINKLMKTTQISWESFQEEMNEYFDNYEPP